MLLSGRVAVVTGAARGIGAAISGRFAAEGAVTALVDRDLQEARRTAADVGGTAFGCDVSRLRQVNAVFSEVCRSLGPIDILVNNAGIWRYTPVLEVTQGRWDEVFDVNVKGIFHCARAAAAYMMPRRSGKIVNVASVAGFGGSAAWSAYCASKAAALSLTLSLADALRESRVQVHAVCPGATRTDMLRKIEEEEPGSRFDRVHEPAEVAEQVLELVVPWDQTDTGRIVTMKPVGTAFGLPTEHQAG